MNNQGKGFKILVPVLSVLLGFLLGAVIMLIFGYDPILGYQAMFETAFRSRQNMSEILVSAAPLIFTALGFAVASTAGFFNIGLSGQAMAGWISSIWVALLLPDLTKWVALPVAILVGVLFGAITAAIPGILRAYFGTSEVIVTIMMNYIILNVSNYLANSVMKSSLMANKGVTKDIGANASLQTKFLSDISEGSRLNWGIALAVVALIVIWFVMKKTTLGFEIQSVGLNPFASEYAGMNNRRTAVLSMLISGALAGLGGVVYGLGTFQNFSTQGQSLSIGFDGMAVSLLGGGSSIGIFLAAILFSILKLGGQGMPLIAEVPTELVDVVIASIIFFVGISYLIYFLLGKRKAKPTKTYTKEGGTI